MFDAPKYLISWRVSTGLISLFVSIKAIIYKSGFAPTKSKKEKKQQIC